MWALALREEIVMNIYVRKNWQNQLVPNDEPSLKLLQKMKKDKVYKVKVTQPRNVMFHRKYFVLLDTIFDYQRMFGDGEEEAFRYWITCKAGFYEIKTMPGGQKVAFAKSISFAKMDEFEFQKLYDKTLEVALSHKDICAGIDQDDLLKEAQERIMEFA